MPKQQVASDSDEDERLDEGNDAPRSVADVAPAWLVDLRRSLHRRGFYQSLGDYALMYVERSSDHLVVSFDNLSSARDDSINREPWGYGFVSKNGWSHLGILAFRGEWFRNDELIQALQGLTTSGFFKRFKSVTLIGTSMGGYAACAFSSLIPGCRVIAFSPQSTLKADLVPWEDRFGSGRKANWDGPFADAATETAGAESVWLIYDPFFTNDRKHIERFTGPNVVPLRARHGGHKTALILRRAELLSTIVREAVEGRMSEQRFYQHYRKVRQMPWFTNTLADMAFSRQRQDLVLRLIQHLRRSGRGFSAHNLRKKAVKLFGVDPLAPKRSPVIQHQSISEDHKE